MTKNFLEDNQFRKRNNSAKIIDIVNSYNPQSTTIFYDVDYHPKRRLRPLPLAVAGLALALLARLLLARKQS